MPRASFWGPFGAIAGACLDSVAGALGLVSCPLGYAGGKLRALLYEPSWFGMCFSMFSQWFDRFSGWGIGFAGLVPRDSCLVSRAVSSFLGFGGRHF